MLNYQRVSSYFFKDDFQTWHNDITKMMRYCSIWKAAQKMMIISPIPQIILILLPSDFGLLRIALDRMLSQAQAHSCQVASGPRVHGIQLAIFLQPDELNCTSNISGWWFQPTPLKNDGQLVSWDEMTFPTEWKDKQMFQTTTQIYIYIHSIYRKS